ncbi:MAG: class I SAM-dependent methyltransferase [Pseudomonadota bacterium]
MSENYDDAFFEYVTATARRSANRLLPKVLNEIDIRSVLDVGCGLGAWLGVWRDLGVPEVTGIDGEHVNQANLLIDTKDFHTRDLNEPFSLGRQFDLVQTLEVGEHLHTEHAPKFVECLVAHGSIVMFSAAPPGQGGHEHINEQHYDFWRKLFSAHDYQAYDFVRPGLVDDEEIDPWYRYNTFLYANAEGAERMTDAIRQTLVPRETILADLSPAAYKLRKQVIRLLPPPVMTSLARMKERYVAQRLRRA